MKKWIFGSIGLILLCLVGFFGWLYYHHRSAIDDLPKITVAEPNWKVYENPDFGISLESPYEVGWNSDSRPTKSGNTLENLIGSSYGMSKENSSSFIISIQSMRFKGGAVTFNSDNQLKLAETSLQLPSVKDLQFEASPVTCSGLPATLLSGTYTQSDDPVRFSEMIVVAGQQMWHIDVVNSRPSKDHNEIPRIIQSIQIKPSN